MARRMSLTPIVSIIKRTGALDFRRTTETVNRSTIRPVPTPTAMHPMTDGHQPQFQSFTTLASSSAETAPSWACARFRKRLARKTITNPTASSPMVSPLIRPKTRVPVFIDSARPEGLAVDRQRPDRQEHSSGRHPPLAASSPVLRCCRWSRVDDDHPTELCSGQ